MKQIEPLEIWNNGISKIAEYIKVTGTYDNYESSANNFWQLFTKVDNEPGEAIAQGNCTIDGQDYQNWADATAPNANAWIYNYAANKLNLTIVTL